MPLMPQQPLAPFASLPVAASPASRRRLGLAQLFTAPFRDVDDRAMELVANNRRRRDDNDVSAAAAAPRR